MQREYPEAPLMGVGAVIVHEERVLLIRRGSEPMKGCWSIPGGLVELGESIEAAVRRETLEETGLEVEPVALVELLDRIHREATRVRYHYVIADYLCRVIGGQARAGSDAADLRWASRKEWFGGLSPSALDGQINLDLRTASVVEAGWQMASQRQMT